jgi:gluconolactonase
MNKIFCAILLLAVPGYGQPQPGDESGSTIPSGEVHGPFIWKSSIYPGTEQNYWIYVPAQYDATKPACTMIVQDGLSRATGWNLPAVLDSLIQQELIPVTIGIFIDHGRVAADGDHYERFNRSFEYDALGDRYARFLLEEILPEVRKSYNISANPNDRCIAGASSGAICAFNAAWERPDAFRRVLSSIGTYVGLRGGDEFPTLIRKTEPKPLRVFLQDGSNDLNIYGGDWWMANQTMLSALTWAGYEVNHNWGHGGHNSEHTARILPEVLIWLWKDYPQPVKIHPNSVRRTDLVIEDEAWKELTLPGVKAIRLAINHAGQLFFSSDNAVYAVGPKGEVSMYATLKGKVGGISFYQDGKLYACDIVHKKIVAIDRNGKQQDVVSKVHADFLTISKKGIYFSDSPNERVGFFNFSTGQVQYYPAPNKPTGISISAEKTFLNVGVENGVLGYSFKINDDGSLDFRQEYQHFHVPYGLMTPRVMGMTGDAENHLYVATAMGIQVVDQLGRVNFIFSRPAIADSYDVKIGGDEFATMYITCEGKLYSRKIKAKGVLGWGEPATPPKPHL